MLSKGTQDFNTGQAYPIGDPQVRINVLTCAFAECLLCSTNLVANFVTLEEVLGRQEEEGICRQMSQHAKNA